MSVPHWLTKWNAEVIHLLICMRTEGSRLVRTGSVSLHAVKMDFRPQVWEIGLHQIGPENLQIIREFSGLI